MSSMFKLQNWKLSPDQPLKSVIRRPQPLCHCYHKQQQSSHLLTKPINQHQSPTAPKALTLDTNTQNKSQHSDPHLFQLFDSNQIEINDSKQLQLNNSIHVPSSSKIPRHIAIIMDGNGRWAKQRGLPVTHGHRAGANALLQTVSNCLKLNELNVLTVFALSLENLQRPRIEVEFLFSLFETVLENETKRLEENGVQLRFFGDLQVFPQSLQRSITKAEERSRDNQKLVLNVGLGKKEQQSEF
eukprot:TRINITY_DN5932_c0_g1_i4.p2 TRINITY_DN5932_c0_g1~~TRINITY_DN5932_c0_g1_i4.p2  ORF type:complete len:243 (+),score=19.97 TRINITY_DN5932_c0_g1_i4:39-767(+)